MFVKDAAVIIFTSAATLLSYSGQAQADVSKNATACYGNINNFLHLGCEEGEKILVTKMIHGAKHDSLNCPSVASTDEYKRECCRPSPDDCTVVVVNALPQWCNGLVQCELPVTWSNTDRACDQDEFPPSTTYMLVEYTCVTANMADDCISNPCQHGECTQLIGDYRCDCESGYTGQNCETAFDPCSPNPCENNGVCTKNVTLSENYQCQCANRWTGVNCSEAYVTDNGASAYECSCHLQVCTDVYFHSKKDLMSTQSYYQCVNNVYCVEATHGSELRDYMLKHINDDIIRWDERNSGTSFQPTFALTVSLLTLCGNVPRP